MLVAGLDMALKYSSTPPGWVKINIRSSGESTYHACA